MSSKPSVGPRKVLPTHDFSLQNDKGQAIGFKYANGQASIIERPATPSTIQFTGGGTKFGDWEPGFSHIEQRSWKGGRNSKDFSLDSSRFWDSQNMFSMLDDQLVPTLQWKTATGLRTALQTLPGDVHWKSLISSERYIASPFTVGGSNMGADNVSLWLRRIGSPGTFTFEIWTDSTGEPGTLVASATDSVSTTDITDYISEFRTFDLSAASDLTASTAYWVVVYGASTDNKNSHWEVGANAVDTSYDSADGSTWASSGFTMYTRVADADTKRELIPFKMLGAEWRIDKLASGGNSTIYLNGELGEATGGTTTTLVDTRNGLDGSWVDDQWNGWYVKIVSGTGQGQHALITDTVASTNTISFAAIDIAPSTDSIYVIYGGDAWQSFAAGAAVKDIAVFNNIAYMANGLSDFIRSFYFEPADSPPALVFYDDTASYADFFHVFPDSVDGPQIWRGENDVSGDGIVVSRASTVAVDTDLSFGGDILVGDKSSLITNLHDYDKKLYVFKTDGVYTATKDRVEQLNVGLDFIKGDNNGQAAIVHKLFLMFSWGNFTIQRLYGSDLTDIGFQQGIGLPSGRKGKTVALASHPAGLFACVDADDGTSSILFREDTLKGWHEIFRSPKAGWRVRSLSWQDNPGTRPRLWFECNGELFYQEWPKDTFNPVEDSGINYQHEGVIEYADIDMGVARLPKFFKELSVLSSNLGVGKEIYLAYQADDDIDTSTWIQLGRYGVSPEQQIEINQGSSYKIRLRLRLVSNDADSPVKILGTVLEAFSRTPNKKQWTVRIKASTFQVTGVGSKDSSPDDIYDFLNEAAERAQFVKMYSKYKKMDDITVIVEPPTTTRKSVSTIIGSWSGEFEFTLREA